MRLAPFVLALLTVGLIVYDHGQRSWRRRDFSGTPPRGFGTILVTFMVNQNRPTIVFCLFEAVNGRFASAIDRPKQAA
jgi:hypothetical protein